MVYRDWDQTVVDMLRLTKKADYSLIALKHLAAKERNRKIGTAVSAKEVAD